MKRGEVWTVSGGKDYAGKPRPVVVVQDDAFDATDSGIPGTQYATDIDARRWVIASRGADGL
jgi:mRNA-degrading endonuclease toxin of MazEF toxin-antitoxin module